MTVQCQIVGQTVGQTMSQTAGQTANRARRPTPSTSGTSLVWLRQAYLELRSQIDQWLLDRKIARTRLSIQNLPEHIRQDIGWPQSTTAFRSCDKAAPRARTQRARADLRQ